MKKATIITLTVIGTAAATGVALNYLTDGAVVDALKGAVSFGKEKVVEGAEAVASATEAVAEAVVE